MARTKKNSSLKPHSDRCLRHIRDIKQLLQIESVAALFPTASANITWEEYGEDTIIYLQKVLLLLRLSAKGPKLNAKEAKDWLKGRKITSTEDSTKLGQTALKKLKESLAETHGITYRSLSTSITAGLKPDATPKSGSLLIPRCKEVLGIETIRGVSEVSLFRLTHTICHSHRLGKGRGRRSWRRRGCRRAEFGRK